MTAHTDADAVSGPRETHYRILQLLLMLGFLFHAAEEWDQPVAVVGTIGAIHAFLLRERLREWGFLGFLVGVAASHLAAWPGLANHSNVTLFACLLLVPMQARRALGRSTDDERDRVLAALRWIAVLTYFFAGFHKLNRDFLDPHVSCAFHVTRDYLSALGISVAELPQVLRGGVPAAVIGMELIGALLLTRSRTRRAGVLLILALHAVLAPVGFADFSALGMALLWLFVPPEALSRMPGLRYLTGLTTALVFLQLLLAAPRIRSGVAVHESWEGLALVAGFTPVWVAYMRAGVPGPNLAIPRRWALRAWVLLFCFFAMNNYLGLRTAGTLSMFSNLTTEGERSNHLLLGSNPLKVFGFQEDQVELLNVDRRIRGAMRGALVEGNSLPRVEFARTLARLQQRDHGDLLLAVRYQGERHSTVDLLGDPDFGFPVPWWHTRMLQFRPIQPAPPQRCRW